MNFTGFRGWDMKADLVFKKVLPPHQYMYNYAMLLIDTLSYIVYMGRVEIIIQINFLRYIDSKKKS